MRPGEETSVEEWEERFRKDVKRRPGWSVLPIEMLFSQAYRSLTGSAQLALQFALSQVSWEKTRRPGKRKNLRNDTIYLPTNALIALGIKSSATRTALRKDLIERGFLDVKKTGSYLNCGVFRVSGRWRYYPNGDYKPQEQPPAGISMGHRFKGKDGDEESNESSFLRLENERKGGLIFERKGIPEKPVEDPSLRLKNERKALRLENKRTVLCTRAEQSYDIQGVHVQVKEDLGEEEARDLSHNPSELSHGNQDSPDEFSPDSSLNEEGSGEDKPITLQHQWFIDSFSSACLEKEVEAELTLDQSLASLLDDWLDKRLSKRSYLGNKVFYDETVPRIKEKLSQIISQWEFIDFSYLGERLQIPAIPDLAFLVTYREAIFTWVSEHRRHSLNRILAQFETKAAPAHTH